MSPDTPPFAPRDVMAEVAMLQAQRYRHMAPDEKLRLADAMWRLSWDLTCAGVRDRNPALDAAAVAATARVILRAAAD